MPRPSLAALAMALLPTAALAHPHVFIDAGLALHYDAEGRLASVEVEWTYDAFYSMLILEDHGITPGGANLTAAELAPLHGFDGDWEPGFEGSLYLGVEGRRIALAPPHSFTAALVDGRLVSRHVRPLAEPLPGELPLLVEVYDPEFYVDFSMPAAPVIRGRSDCGLDYRPGDSYAAADAYAAALRDALRRELGALADEGAEEMVRVDIGSVGADEVRVRCGGGS